MKKNIFCFIYILISIVSFAQTQYDYYDDNAVAGGAERAFNGLLIIILLIIGAVVLILVLGGALNIYYWFNPKAAPEYKRRLAKIEKEKQHQQYVSDMRIKAVPKAIDLGLSVMWGDFNLGAYKSSDVGDKFYWAENTPSIIGHPRYYKANTNVIGDISGDKKYDAATNLMGENWRLPTKKEFEELLEKCNWEKKTIDEIDGMLVKGPNKNSIFLPFTDSGYHTQDIVSGYYWSSCPSFNSRLNDSSIDLRIGIDFIFPGEVACSTAYMSRCCIRPVYSLQRKNFSEEKKKILYEFSKLKYYTLSNIEELFNLYEEDSKLKDEDLISKSKYSLEFNEDNIIKDEYGVIYSKDGKRLLDATNCSCEEYYIKEGTEIICIGSFRKTRYRSFSDWFSTCEKIFLPKSLLYLPQSIIRNDLKIISKSPYYSIIDNLIIDQRKKSIIKCLDEFKQIVVIGEPIVEIEEDAFRNLVALKEVQLPSTLKRIGARAFRNCQNLSKINLNDSIEIGSEAFLFCRSLNLS